MHKHSKHKVMAILYFVMYCRADHAILCHVL